MENYKDYRRIIFLHFVIIYIVFFYFIYVYLLYITNFIDPPIDFLIIGYILLTAMGYLCMIDREHSLDTHIYFKKTISFIAATLTMAILPVILNFLMEVFFHILNFLILDHK